MNGSGLKMNATAVNINEYTKSAIEMQYDWSEVSSEVDGRK